MAKKKSTRKKATSKAKSKPKKILSSRQKRHRAVQKAISNYNKRQKAGNRLDRKQFWEAYRLAKAETAKQPVRGLIGKISKQDWGARVGGGSVTPVVVQNPSKRGKKFPPQLGSGQTICWYDIIEEIEQYGTGYFQDADVLIFRFQSINNPFDQVTIANLDSISFIFDDYRTKGEVVMNAELRAYNDFYSIVQDFSPPPCFQYNDVESDPNDGVFIWDLEPDPTWGLPSLKSSAVKRSRQTQAKVKTVDDLIRGMDEETLREITKKASAELKKMEGQKKAKKTTKKPNKKKGKK